MNVLETVCAGIEYVFAAVSLRAQESCLGAQEPCVLLQSARAMCSLTERSTISSLTERSKIRESTPVPTMPRMLERIAFTYETWVDHTDSLYYKRR